MTDSGSVIDWLLDSDPSIRWPVMRDLLDAPEPEWRAERATVETEGWGARLLSYQDEDGQWAGGAFLPRGFDFREWQEAGRVWFDVDDGAGNPSRWVTLRSMRVLRWWERHGGSGPRSGAHGDR